MFLRWPQEGSSSPPLSSSSFPLLLLLLPFLLSSPPPSLADSPPPLLSLLVPWAAEDVPGAAVGGSLETLGEAPYLATPEDGRRFEALLESDRMQDLTGGPAAPDQWESPKNPDLFLLTEMGREEGRRRRDADAQEEAAAHVAPESKTHRLKRNGGFVSGSRIRTGGNGGGFAGSSGMRVGGNGAFGPGRMGAGQMNGRMSEGPSLSIVNPLDVLRQRLLLEIARRRMRESEGQIQANRELLKSIGKREAGRADDARGGEGPPPDNGNDGNAQAKTPSSM